MRGQPLSRAMSPDGRWAYTLYDGNGKTPFVHALDTSRATARCIDLDAIGGAENLWRLRLAIRGDGKQLAVRDGSQTELVVSTRTFAVSKPSAPAPAAQESSLTWPWAAGAARSRWRSPPPAWSWRPAATAAPPRSGDTAQDGSELPDGSSAPWAGTSPSTLLARMRVKRSLNPATNASEP